MIFSIPVYDLESSGIDHSRLVGNNARRMMVLLRETDFKSHGDLLRKILGAVKYDLDQDAYVYQMTEAAKVVWRDVTSPVDHLLLFGIAPAEVGLSITSKRRLIVLEEVTIIRAPSLEVISANTDEKRKLWEILKHTFMP